MTELHELRVFVSATGTGGNPLGVFLDGGQVPERHRQAVARRLGFSETVFVDSIQEDAGSGGAIARLRIFTPGMELPFAGHPTVGTSWLLGHLGTPVGTLACVAGDVETWHDEGLTWIRARAEWVHAIEIRQFPTVAEVDALVPGGSGEPGVYAWAWEDEEEGRLRSRYFAGDVGILEDEATGAAAVVMGSLLQRPLTIRQGVGSELHVRPDAEAGTVDVGGRSELVATRTFEVQPSLE